MTCSDDSPSILPISFDEIEALYENARQSLGKMSLQVEKKDFELATAVGRYCSLFRGGHPNKLIAHVSLNEEDDVVVQVTTIDPAKQKFHVSVTHVPSQLIAPQEIFYYVVVIAPTKLPGQRILVSVEDAKPIDPKDSGLLKCLAACAVGDGIFGCALPCTTDVWLCLQCLGMAAVKCAIICGIVI